MVCMLVTHDRFEAARLSHEIMLLSTKGMNVQNVITRLRRCPNAIRLLKKPWWQESFRGFIIMSDRNLNF